MYICTNTSTVMAVIVVSRHVINLAAELVTDVLVSVVVAAGVFHPNVT